MKRTTVISALAALGIALLAGCAKEGTAAYRGNYSFKTSGILYTVRDPKFIYDTSYVVRRDSSNRQLTYIDTVITEFPDSSIVSIYTESGQMDITETGGDEMLLTMNVTGGDLVVAYATEQDGKLVLKPLRRKVNTGLSISSLAGEGRDISYSESRVEADVVVSGTGTRYDNIVLFELTYEGSYKYNNILYHIYDSEVNCRAKVNE